jgi:hypothetical protein
MRLMTDEKMHSIRVVPGWGGRIGAPTNAHDDPVAQTMGRSTLRQASLAREGTVWLSDRKVESSSLHKHPPDATVRTNLSTAVRSRSSPTTINRRCIAADHRLLALLSNYDGEQCSVSAKRRTGNANWSPWLMFDTLSIF